MEPDLTLGGPSSFPGAVAFGDGQDNHLIATIGRALLEGFEGDDILEDHNAETSAVGSAGNDRLISRNGRDFLWGGNPFGLTTCTDTDTGEEDEATQACADYTAQ